MTALEIVFKSIENLTPLELEEMNEVDHLAFYEEDGDDDWWQEWAPPQMRWLMKEEGHVVSTVGLIRREILAGEIRLRIGGIGGVATRPDRQRLGYAARLMEASAQFMQSDPWFQYGMLFCDQNRIPYYSTCRYVLISNELYVRRNEARQPFTDSCMVLDLRGEPFPGGVVDCLGLPW